ncbi:hypothetical protein GCM10027517_21310 [Phycicoccus ginsengisoli]
MSTRSACFPVSPTGLTRALQAQQAFAKAVDDWHVWLEAGSPCNADQLLLYRIITESRDRRESSGIWADVPATAIPTVAQMNDVLDQTKMSLFAAQIEAVRHPVEQAGLALCDALDSTELRLEVLAMPELQRLEYIAEIMTSLSSCNVGMLFMRRSICMDQSPLPVIHPDHLINSKLDLKGATAASRRAARAWAHVALKIIPAVVKDTTDTGFSRIVMDYLGRYFPDGEIVVSPGAKLEDTLVKARQLVADRAPWWLHAKGMGSVQLLFDVINFSVASRAAWSDPSFSKNAALARALGSLVSSVSSVSKAFKGESYLLTLSKPVSAGLSIANAVYDAGMAVQAVYEARESYVHGDLSVAAGNTMAGVGLGASAIVATAVSLSELEIVAISAAVIPGLQVVALGALALILIGTIIATTTVDTPFEQWLQNGWFGNRWDSLDPEQSPDTPLYRTKTLGGTPDLGRQVSYWLSMLYPIELATSRSADGSNIVTLTCQPPWPVPADASLTLWRIDELGAIEHEYPQKLIYHGTAAEVSRDGVIPSTSGAGPDVVVTQWLAQFGPMDWSQETDPAFDMKGHWVELELTLTGGFDPGLTQGLLSGPEGPEWSFPLTTRIRTKVS